MEPAAAAPGRRAGATSSRARRVPRVRQRHRRPVRRRRARARPRTSCAPVRWRETLLALRAAGHRALRRARARRRPHRPGEAHAGGRVIGGDGDRHGASRRRSGADARRPHGARARATRRPLPRGLTAGLFGVGAALPEHVIDQRALRGAPRHDRRVDRAAHRHPRAPLARRRRAARRRWPPTPAPTRWPTPAARPTRSTSVIVTTITPDQRHARAWRPRSRA